MREIIPMHMRRLVLGAEQKSGICMTPTEPSAKSCRKLQTVLDKKPPYWNNLREGR